MSKISIQIFLSMLFILVTGAVVLIYGINENQRMTRQDAAAHARAIEQGAALFEQQCSRCHGTQGTGIPGLCPPLNDRNFFDYRLEEVNWAGSLEDYIVATVSSGRLVSTRPQTYPGQGTPAMPSFS
ncbi:MAG: c-type cytochrome, partial [Anaerolineales bacterium]|nr:c-type cytochrome [Anaerolineales bacterium]